MFLVLGSTASTTAKFEARKFGGIDDFEGQMRGSAAFCRYSIYQLIAHRSQRPFITSPSGLHVRLLNANPKCTSRFGIVCISINPGRYDRREQQYRLDEQQMWVASFQ